MSNQRPRRRQRRVLRLEATRAAATIGYLILALIAVAVSAAAVWFYDNPARAPRQVPAPALGITAVAAAFLAVLSLIAAVVNGRRWRLARAVERLSNNPELAHFRPEDSQPEFLPRAQSIPPLEVELVRSRRLPKPRPLRRVTTAANVVGKRPLSIAYLRLFENQARMTTFIQSAWREFGRVHFLRSAASVTPAEFRDAKRTGNLSLMFAVSREQFLAELAKSPSAPGHKHRHVFRNIAPRPIKVWDRYRAYPPAGYLCHGVIWKMAVDQLLHFVDLVVLDLSGFTTANLGTGYELQRVIDRFPVERVIFLADTYSDRGFLSRQIHSAWQRMAAGSPNSGTQPRSAWLVVTDHYRRPPRAPIVTGGSGPGQGPVVVQQQPPGKLRLEASRRQSRRLAAAVQQRVLQAEQATSVPRPAEPWPDQPQLAGREPPTSPMRRVPAATRSTPDPAATRSTPDPAATRSTPEPAAASGSPGPGWRLAGQLAALAGSILFLASIILLPNYTSQSYSGPVSFYHAIRNDSSSPLRPPNFWIAVALIAIIIIFTIISFAAAGRLPLAVVTLTALGLTGYTLYLPRLGSDGFSVYGSGYWASLVAAAIIVLGAALSTVRA